MPELLKVRWGGVMGRTIVQVHELFWLPPRRIASIRSCNFSSVTAASREVVFVIHWAGGRHSELRVNKGETGRSRRCTDPEAIEVLRQMAGKFTDQQIAATLNRLSPPCQYS